MGGANQSGHMVLASCETVPPVFTETPLALHPSARGWGKQQQLPSGLLIAYEKFDLDRGFHESYGGDDFLQLHIRLSGQSRIKSQKTIEQTIDSSTFGILIHPNDAEKRHYRSDVGGSHESVTLICNQQMLNDIYRIDPTLNPPEISRFLTGQACDFYLAAMPLKAEMAMAARALLECNIDRSVQHLYVEAKALELLSYSFEILHGMARPASQRHQISARDIRRLREAHELISAHYINPLTIKEIARRVGVNEPKLCVGFKSLFGLTIYELTQKLRMSHALDLLRDSEMSITQIAFDVGYEHPSNFATAFKRITGISPTAARSAAKTSSRPSIDIGDDLVD
ncbi:AraC family transcriptional regulator [Kineobactrum salinum]|uniref:Helix-turn-helix transcriptional regulator n=1 Tax=Kineobactrum salinum TaxID=2708301 RepID=A0A6C0U0V6_9GAMM|nr:AraC family transcriptional regulator [Kineobactrum salinum]QIB64607.1 helix-turn-helix transcriptional regulator [Kineobactrum salinum]